MVTAIDNALSGLAASSRRLQVSANNIANQFSTKSVIDGQPVDQPFVPQRVDQVSLSNGGVITEVRNVEPPTVTVPDVQNNSTQEVPNVDLANEFVQIQLASYDFKANLKAVKVQDNLLKSLLDITS